MRHGGLKQTPVDPQQCTYWLRYTAVSGLHFLTETLRVVAKLSGEFSISAGRGEACAQAPKISEHWMNRNAKVLRSAFVLCKYSKYRSEGKA